MKKIKLLGICTSSRGRESNTYYLMNKVFGLITDSNVQRGIIVASELNLKPCNHYYSQSSKMCVYPCLVSQNNQEDEMKKIYNAILEADIVIFSTPICWGNHSHLMQLIIERLNSMENANSVHKKVLVKNKIGGIMVLGHEDGYQHVVGGLMNFMTCLGLIFPPQAYAAWVGDSERDTKEDRARIENDKLILEKFSDLVSNLINFTRYILDCPCNREFDYEHLSQKKLYKE